METYQNYNGYGITYSTITGDTVVDDGFLIIELFLRMGESKGLEEAKKYIDNLTKS